MSVGSLEIRMRFFNGAKAAFGRFGTGGRLASGEVRRWEKRGGRVVEHVGRTERGEVGGVG